MPLRNFAVGPDRAAQRRWLLLAAMLWLAACSKDKDIDQPAALPAFGATVRLEKVWGAAVADKGAQPLRLGLGLAVDGNRVFAAGHRGEIAAFDLGSGRLLWRTRTPAELSGGPGTGAGLVVVGSSRGDVIAVNASDGAIRWQVRVNGEILAAPAVSERLIALRTTDGKLRGLAPKDGHELWSQEQQVPRLSLRGTSWPVLSGDLVLCGFDNGKVAAVNANDGSVQWETTISPPHGRTELERLDDIDSSVRVSGADVYTVGFQGRIAMLALDTGQIWWSHETSSYRGLALDDRGLYVSTADGEVLALNPRTGTEIWRQKALLHRRLSAATETDHGIVVGDFQGYVHWLDKATGAIIGRESSGKARVSSRPVAAGNLVLVVNDVGRISAFRTTPIPGAKPTPMPKPAAPGTAAAPETAAPAPSTAAPEGASNEGAVSPIGSDAAGAASAVGTAGAGTAAAPVAPVEPSAPQPLPQEHPSSVPASTPGSEPAQAAPNGATTPSAAPPVTPPTTPPASRPPPLPSQPTPDPTPPLPQTQPQPPPS